MTDTSPPPPPPAPPKRNRPFGRPRPNTREEVARLYVRGLPINMIAKRVGAARESVSRWLREPGVQKRIAELGAEAKREVSLELERAAPKAARAFVKMVEGRAGRNWQQRARGASEVLDRAGFGKSEKHEHTVQGNAGAAAIALAIEKKRKREGRE